METDVIKPKLKEKIIIKKPKKYKVIFFNDDFTPFSFVIEVLIKIFGKTEAESTLLAQKVHNENSAIVGLYPQDIAETKKQQTIYNAKLNGFPLMCELEEEEQ